MRPAFIYYADRLSACDILKITGRKIAIVVAHQDLNTALGLRNAFTTYAGQAYAFLKELKAFLERQIA